ncbi:glycosyltransferase family 4 protein [bacterium]|nr:glycosyltransferase family 4 protein [bacterium]
MSARRVLIVNGKAEAAGSDRSLLELISTMDRSRWVPSVVAPGEGPLTPTYRKHATVHKLELGVVSAATRASAYPLMVLWQLRSARSIAAIVRRESIDVVHANTLIVPAALLGARMAGAKATMHAREIIARWPRVHAAYVAIGRRADLVAAISEDVARTFPERDRRTGHVRVVPDGVDLAPFNGAATSAEEARVRLGLAPGALVLGVAGRLAAWKGVEDALEAAAHLLREGTDLQLVIAGGAMPSEPDLPERLRARARALSIEGRVHLLGQRDDLPLVLPAFSVLVHAARAPEPFGRVLVEAMAASVSVVATAHGGPREIVVPEETGLLVPPGDPDALVAAVGKLARDAVLRERMGRAGRERAFALYDSRANTRAMMDIWDEVVFRRSGVRRGASWNHGRNAGGHSPAAGERP